jgi:hypothetical protein
MTFSRPKWSKEAMCASQRQKAIEWLLMAHRNFSNVMGSSMASSNSPNTKISQVGNGVWLGIMRSPVRGVHVNGYTMMLTHSLRVVSSHPNAVNKRMERAIIEADTINPVLEF